MATSKYKLAEQVLSILGKDKYSWQEIMVAITQSLASAVKREFFLGKEDGVTEVNGAFIYSFEDIAVSLDSTRNRYYSELPASYINLPHDYGITSVGKTGTDDYDFVRLPPAGTSLFQGLDANSMEGRQTFYVEGGQKNGSANIPARLYFPKMTAGDNITKILIRLAVSLDGIDDDTNINIPNDVQEQVINMVVARYAGIQQKEKSNG